MKRNDHSILGELFAKKSPYQGMFDKQIPTWMSCTIWGDVMSFGLCMWTMTFVGVNVITHNNNSNFYYV
jgi:hypothetical protein